MRVQLNIRVKPELRDWATVAAAERGQCLGDFVISLIERERQQLEEARESDIRALAAILDGDAS